MAEKVTYREAKEVEEIAKDLIQKYHQPLIDFNVDIRYCFVNKTTIKGNKEIWGTCQKISGKNAYLAENNPDNEPFFLITISEPVWSILPLDKKEALVDHELCHCFAEVKQEDDDSDFEQDNPVKLSVKPHDLEEFSCIVKRHGLWREEIEDFVKAATKEIERKI